MSYKSKTLSWELKYLKKGFTLTGLTSDTGRHFYTPFSNVNDFTTNPWGGAGTGTVSTTSGGGIFILTTDSTSGATAGRYANTWIVPTSMQSIPFYVATRFKVPAVEVNTNGYLRMSNVATFAQEAIIGFMGDTAASNFMFYQNYTGGSKLVLLPVVDTNWHDYEMYGIGDGNLHVIFDGVTYNITGLSWTNWVASRPIFSCTAGTTGGRTLQVDDALLLVPKSP